MDMELEEIGAILTAGKGANAKLSSTARAVLVGAVAGGTKPAEVARAFGVSRRAVSSTIQRFLETHSFEDKPRSGRPSVVTPQDKRYFEQQMKRTPDITYGELAKAIVESDAAAHPGTGQEHPGRDQEQGQG